MWELSTGRTIQFVIGVLVATGLCGISLKALAELAGHSKKAKKQRDRRHQ